MGGGAERRACGATRKDGAPCRSFALPSGFCVSHDPAHEAAMRESRSRGAAAAGKLRKIEGRLSRLDTAAALLRFAGTLVHKVAGGDVDPDTARACFYGISVCRQLVEVAELEARVRKLQAAQGRQRWA